MTPLHPLHAVPSRAASLLAEPVRSIAVFRALFLGDLLCSTPALRALRQRFPEATITLIGLPWARDLVARLPCVDRLLPFGGYEGIAEVPYDPQRSTAFLAAAAAERFDLVLQMHGNGFISNGLVAALKGRFSLGYRCDDPDPRLHHSLVFDPKEHEVLRWLRLVAELDAHTSDTSLVLPVTPAEQAAAAALLSGAAGTTGPLIGLHAGAKDSARRWPPERFAVLANALVERFDARIVLTGSAAEQTLTAALRQALRVSALDLAGQTELGTFAALISQLDLLVTNDTGASHIAAATRTASVVLFGSMRPHNWAPLDKRLHRVIDAQVEVPEADADHALAQLPVATVMAACDDMLTREAPALLWQSPAPEAARDLALEV